MKKSVITVIVQLVIISLVIIVNAKTASALIRINEIMYNPKGGDDGNEYIEIYYDEIINLSNHIIGDIVSNDTLKLVKSSANNNFALIVEEGFDYTKLNCPIYSSGKSIGSGLGNKGDTIFLFDKNSKVIDKVTYTNNYANGNGKSLSLVNGFWFEQEQSPCEQNFVSNEFVNNINDTVSSTYFTNNNNNKYNNTDVKIGINIEIRNDDNNATNNLVTSKLVFESKEQKIKRFLPYFIMTILLMISIVLVWRR